jgi:hypothetical protein
MKAAVQAWDSIRPLRLLALGGELIDVAEKHGDEEEGDKVRRETSEGRDERKWVFNLRVWQL